MSGMVCLSRRFTKGCGNYRFDYHFVLGDCQGAFLFPDGARFEYSQSNIVWRARLIRAINSFSEGMKKQESAGFRPHSPVFINFLLIC
jgi:hypothetical protein